MIGAELTFALRKEISAYTKRGKLAIRTGCRLTSLITDETDETDQADVTEAAPAAAGGAVAVASRVLGVRYLEIASGKERALHSPQVVLATGGYANDRTNTSLLAKHRPDLVPFPTTLP